MHLKEYVEKAKEELDKFEQMWLEGHASDPDNWPLDIGEGEWNEQEKSVRFSNF